MAHTDPTDLTEIFVGGKSHRIMWEGLTQIQQIQQKILFVKFVGFVFFLNLPQIQAIGKFVGTLIIRALGALGVI